MKSKKEKERWYIYNLTLFFLKKNRDIIPNKLSVQIKYIMNKILVLKI